jgi:hypothetical protein
MPHGVSRSRTDELLLAGEFELNRASSLENGQRDDVLDQHLLLAAETAADAFAEDAHFLRIEIEQVGQPAPREKRRLCARSDIETPGFVEPADRAVGFQMRVLHPLRHKGAFI